MLIPYGLTQQTAAVRALFMKAAGGRVATTRRRKPKRARKTATVRKTKRAAKKGNGKLMRLKKGSAAAKAYMAKIRKLRK